MSAYRLLQGLGTLAVKSRKIALKICFCKKNFLNKNTPGTAGGPGGRDRTLAVKSRKIAEKSAFFRKTLFRTREFPRSGSKAQDGEKKRKKKRREKLNDGDNNGQATTKLEKDQNRKRPK